MLPTSAKRMYPNTILNCSYSGKTVFLCSCWAIPSSSRHIPRNDQVTDAVGNSRQPHNGMVNNRVVLPGSVYIL